MQLVFTIIVLRYLNSAFFTMINYFIEFPKSLFREAWYVLILQWELQITSRRKCWSRKEEMVIMGGSVTGGRYVISSTHYLFLLLFNLYSNNYVQFWCFKNSCSTYFYFFGRESLLMFFDPSSIRTLLLKNKNYWIYINFLLSRLVCFYTKCWSVTHLFTPTRWSVLTAR